MMRFLLPAGVFAALALVLFIGVQRAPEKSVIPSALIGQPAPQFELPILGSNDTFNNASLQGQWYLLNVWGTWCPECVNEHQMLLEIARTRALPMIGLNWKDDDSAAQRWLAQLGDPYDVVAVDREGRVAIDWGVYGAPETFLVNARGEVEYKHVGAMTQQVWREKFLSRLPEGAASVTDLAADFVRGER
jgi:cytochrome c biogenesis protein CcmG/thiol:disulfide interchange protein DsbE